MLSIWSNGGDKNLLEIPQNWYDLCFTFENL